MSFDLDARIPVDGPEGHSANHVAVDPAQGGAASTTEADLPAVLGGVPTQRLRLADPAKGVVGQEAERRAGTAEDLAATGAVTGLRSLERAMDLVTQCAAEAASGEHPPTLLRGGAQVEG